MLIHESNCKILVTFAPPESATRTNFISELHNILSTCTSVYLKNSCHEVACLLFSGAPTRAIGK